MQPPPLRVGAGPPPQAVNSSGEFPSDLGLLPEVSVRPGLHADPPGLGSWAVEPVKGNEPHALLCHTCLSQVACGPGAADEAGDDGDLPQAGSCQPLWGESWGEGGICTTCGQAPSRGGRKQGLMWGCVTHGPVAVGLRASPVKWGHVPSLPHCVQDSWVPSAMLDERGRSASQIPVPRVALWTITASPGGP